MSRESPGPRGRYAERPSTAPSAPADRTAMYLADLDDRLREGERIVADGRQAFMADSFEGRRQRGYARMLVIEVAEIVTVRLPQELRDAHPQIPWRDISDTLSYPAHDYRGTDDGVIWAVLERRLPQLRRALLGQRGAERSSGRDGPS